MTLSHLIIIKQQPTATIAHNAARQAMLQQISQ
jgi:hypothetical protein